MAQRYCQQIAWDDVPHLSEDDKARLLDSIPPHQRDARTKGIPILGAGAIYPVSEETLLEEPFEIPNHWPRAYGMDVGWNRTAAIWGAWDRDTDTVHLYAEYYASQQPPVVHTAAIRRHGDWIAGAIDPASSGANQKDGSQLIDEYRGLGLDLVPADNTVEAGIHACYQRMTTGGLKVFSTCRNWLSEFRIYRRDDKGRVVKENDHLMDPTRYLIMTGLFHARTEPIEDDWDEFTNDGRSDISGY